MADARGFRRSPRTGRWYALLAVGVAVTFSCRLDYSSTQIAQKIETDIPDLILTNFTHTSVRHDHKQFEITAANSELFSQKSLQTLDGVKFTEYDTDGKVVTQGSADHAVLHTDTNDVELSGTIQFYSETESAHVECTYLYWNDKDRTLTSKPEDIVRIRKDDGSVISGSDFRADVARREVSFGGPVQGTVVASDTTGNAQ